MNHLIVQRGVALACLALLLSLASGPVRAHTMGEIQVKCPLCSHGFQATVDMSGTQFDMRLDLKPLGPIPAPWKIPVCPQCGFVVFDEEPAAETAAKYEAIVQSDAYKALADRPTYRRLGLLMAELGRDPYLVADTYLKASWQEEMAPERYREDVDLALQYYDQWLEATEDKGEAWWTALVVCGDLERRLGRFDAARARFERLQQVGEPPDPFLAEVVAFELARIEAGDDTSHTVSEVTDSSAKEETEP